LLWDRVSLLGDDFGGAPQDASFFGGALHDASFFGEDFGGLLLGGLLLGGLLLGCHLE